MCVLSTWGYVVVRLSTGARAVFDCRSVLSRLWCKARLRRDTISILVECVIARHMARGTWYTRQSVNVESPKRAVDPKKQNRRIGELFDSGFPFEINAGDMYDSIPRLLGRATVDVTVTRGPDVSVSLYKS